MTRPIHLCTTRLWAMLAISILPLACGGGSTAPAPSEPADAGEAPTETTDPVPTFQAPAVEGELIGFPGAQVPGLNATYVSTGAGWLGENEDEVVFEAVIQWTDTKLLGCGILRRGPDGAVTTVLMQDQRIPSVSGVIKHPRLPLQSNETTLLIPAEIVGGTTTHALFGVPKNGGAPVLLATEPAGLFVGARFMNDGRIAAEVDRGGVRTILAIDEAAAPFPLCSGCAPGFTTDGATIVVRDTRQALALQMDGRIETILQAGDPVPGSPESNSAVQNIRSAWTTPSGAIVVHATTDDIDRPEILVRFVDARTEVLAACGSSAPGTTGQFTALHAAATHHDDVVFAAVLDGDPESGAAIFCARPDGTTELVWKDGLAIPELGGAIIGLEPAAVTAASNGAAAFGVNVFWDGVVAARGVFAFDETTTKRVVTTTSRLAAAADVTLTSLPNPTGTTTHRTADGRTLVYTGLTQDRRPNATLHALILVR